MQQMLANKDVSVLFKTLAGLMELHGENDFRTRSYANAAFQIGRLQDPVMEMPVAELEKAPGIGKSIQARILELRETGTMRALDNLMELTPPGLIEMMRIKGLGGKKIGVIWKELGVESVGELLYACHENRLAMLKGFGEKTQESVIRSIEYFQSNLGKFHFADADAEAFALLQALKKLFPSSLISLSGPVRRRCNILQSIDILGTMRPEDFPEKKIPAKETAHNGDIIKGLTELDIPFRLRCIARENFYYTLFAETGSEAHVQDVLSRVKEDITHCISEEAIYAAAGLPYCIPELREPWISVPSPPSSDILVDDVSIRGVVHNHSTWSDGKNTLREMAEATKSAGYTWFVISDHSKTAVYAGGLQEERIRAQHREVDTLNAELAPFRIFKSIECDILNDGSMDYPDTVLAEFDFVIASIHQNLKMDEEKATARLIRAIENPYTTILGHMTGRLLLSRPGYPVDHKKVIEACAANRVVIEINANPYRLDMDHAWIPYAMQKGVMISINPDAHSTDGIADIHWGVVSARKGGLTRAMTWNAMDRTEVEHWLAERKRFRGIGGAQQFS